MKKYRIETQDFILYMEAKSLVNAVEIIALKYGESFANSVKLIQEI